MLDDITIQMKEKGHTADGIRITFGWENPENSENTPSIQYADLIVSDVLGMFISDTY